jgi:hypothetical protein
MSEPSVDLFLVVEYASLLSVFAVLVVLITSLKGAFVRTQKATVSARNRADHFMTFASNGSIQGSIDSSTSFSYTPPPKPDATLESSRCLFREIQREGNTISSA